MEDLISIFALCSPPLLAALLVKLRRKAVALYWVALALLASPIILYFIWASEQPYIDAKAPVAVLGGAFLIVISITLPLTILWFISKPWLKIVLAPVLYLAGFFIALVVGIEYGMFQK